MELFVKANKMIDRYIYRNILIIVQLLYIQYILLVIFHYKFLNILMSNLCFDFNISQEYYLIALLYEMFINSNIIIFVIETAY